jgi:hypothetical protein
MGACRCRRAALSLDDAEARMRDQRAADSAVPLSLVPKSIKDQAREVAEREGKVGASINKTRADVQPSADDRSLHLLLQLGLEATPIGARPLWSGLDTWHPDMTGCPDTQAPTDGRP